jgi:dihydroorotase
VPKEQSLALQYRKIYKSRAYIAFLLCHSFSTHLTSPAVKSSILLRNVRIVNEGEIIESDLLIRNGRIERIAPAISGRFDEEIEGGGKYLFPGAIDDQVHFREPGLTHKGEIATESRAAVAGGITSFMEMPNTSPQTLTQELLEAKYMRAAEVSPANYSFFMGASNHNLEEVKKTDPRTVCGVKVFMGSSTGDMLVDNPSVLEGIFRDSPTLIAVHCEKEEIVRANLELAKARFGEDIPIAQHPIIRSREACYASSSEAIALARQYGARLHVLHISTADEIALFEAGIPLEEKRITAEACVHHLWFTDADYERLGNRIKWNPAVKSASDREAIRQALVTGAIDVVATDHAPHTLDEKAQLYLKAPSGGPLVQHSLLMMLEMSRQDLWSLEFVAEKMAHNPAILFQIQDRGFIREGYYADLVLVDLESPTEVTTGSLLYKCGWSPLEGETLGSKVVSTWVNGNLVWNDGQIQAAPCGKRLTFNR